MPARRKEVRAEVMTEASRWSRVEVTISLARHTCSMEDRERLEATRWDTKVSKELGEGDASRMDADELEDTMRSCYVPIQVDPRCGFMAVDCVDGIVRRSSMALQLEFDLATLQPSWKWHSVLLMDIVVKAQGHTRTRGRTASERFRGRASAKESSGLASYKLAIRHSQYRSSFIPASIRCTRHCLSQSTLSFALLVLEEMIFDESSHRILPKDPPHRTQD